MAAIEIIEYREYNIEIHQDDNAESPRTACDNLGTMVCFHNRYNLGDSHKFADAQEFLQWLGEEKDSMAIVLPIFMYEHSQVSLSVSNTDYPFNCPWDAGQVGVIYVTKETMRKEYSCNDGISLETIDIATRVLKAEVDEYGKFINGEVYGHAIKPTSNQPEIADSSCWGYYDQDQLLSEAKSTVDCEVEHEAKESIECQLIMAL